MNQTKSTILAQDSQSFSAISLFLRWFMLKETLVKDAQVEKLLDDMDRGEVMDEGEWAESVRRALLPPVIRVLSDILERPLTTEELVYVFGEIEEFIGYYGTGLDPRKNSTLC